MTPMPKEFWINQNKYAQDPDNTTVSFDGETEWWNMGYSKVQKVLPSLGVVTSWGELVNHARPRPLKAQSR